MFIVLLTVLEISITLLSVFELSKGATLHQLNSLHLKNSAIFSRQVNEFSNNSGADIDTQVSDMRSIILEIKQQPLDCLDIVNAFNIAMMKAIGTYEAYELCIKDIEDVNEALAAIASFRDNRIDKAVFLSQMQASAMVFNENSALFEKPITKTVNFLLTVFIPLVVIISLFNILFITYLSRTITESINKVIHVLKNKRQSLTSEEIYATTSGELQELLVVATDRTRQQVIQEEINDKLEELVLKRTELLTHANDELSKFAYRASHDLKGPVSASKTLSQFIQQDIAAREYDNAKMDAEKIEAQMLELENHISGILSLTKATEMKNTIEFISIHTLLMDRVDIAKKHEHGDEVSIEIDVDERLFFEVNKVRLQQILDNLISNAIKYRDRSTKSWLRLNASLQEDTLRIEIIDNGLGFPEASVGDAFDMFTRFHTNVGKGSGIGLAIVKKHVNLMGGRITLASSQQNGSQKGARFVILLPSHTIANGKVESA
jgi:signal transduction histidine kinase